MFSRILVAAALALSLLDFLILLLMARGFGIVVISITQGAGFVFGWIKIRRMDFNLFFFLDAEIKKGQPIIRELWEEALVLSAACLLIMPGFLTDLIGIGFLFPQIRELCFQMVDGV